ncbi:MAG: 2-oxo acid dehydrogenase subunit E2, partial [Chloroflexi bacterium]|nr:2-oxo acid dehydrogenase subunit E2 [Chloroflexota bacterium]
MITPVILPQLGDTMDEGTITRWFKHKGDAVKKGEPLFEVLTDKANIEVEATTSGFLREILHQENETVPTGKTIAYLTTTADEPLNPSPLAPLPTGEGKEAAVLPSPIERGVGGEVKPARKRQFISPRARRVALEFGVDVSQLSASSQSGRIMEADVRKFIVQRAAAPSVTPTAPPPLSVPSQPTTDATIPITGVRKIIFDRMGASAREIARVTLTTEADATRLVELREQLNAQQTEMKFSFTDLVVLLVARALSKYPYMNATLHDDGVQQHTAVNLGVAADTERGLLVPVIRDAQRKGLGEIYAEVRRLSDAARTGKILPDDLRGGTFTITNLGQQEIDAFTP